MLQAPGGRVERGAAGFRAHLRAEETAAGDLCVDENATGDLGAVERAVCPWGRGERGVGHFRAEGRDAGYPSPVLHAPWGLTSVTPNVLPATFVQQALLPATFGRRLPRGVYSMYVPSVARGEYSMIT